MYTLQEHKAVSCRPRSLGKTIATLEKIMGFTFFREINGLEDLSIGPEDLSVTSCNQGCDRGGV